MQTIINTVAFIWLISLSIKYEDLKKTMVSMYDIMKKILQLNQIGVKTPEQREKIIFKK